MEIIGIVAFVLLMTGVVLLALASSGNARREKLRTAARLAAIEQKLDAVVEHLGITVREKEHPEVVRLVQQDKRIEAVRVLRNETGVSLLDAKNAVDAIAARYGR